MRTVVVVAAALLAGCSTGVPVGDANPPARIRDALDLGPTAADGRFAFVVALPLRNRGLLDKLVREQAVTGDRMGRGDFADAFGATAADYRRLVAWLGARGLEVTRTVEARSTVSATGTAAAIERAFGIQLHDYVDAMGRFTASPSGMMVSAEVAGSVGGVIGDFDGAYPWRSHAVRFDGAQPAAAPAPGSGKGGSYRALNLEAMYKSSAIATPGAGESIVILGTGLAPTDVDVAGYYTTDTPYNQKTNPGTYTVELVGGPNRDDPQLANSERLENTLDAQMVAAFAPYASVYHVITATNAAGLFADGITHILDQHPKAIAVSVSYGSCERGAAGEMPILDALFLQARAQGQTWFFAAGDTGSDGCRNGPGNLVASAGWPASSPWVVGVGGTQLVATGGAATGEVAWDSWAGPGINGAGGGGASESLDKPDYQVGVSPDDGARDEPDVAALGGPPGVEVILDGVAIQVGGTSAAAPMWAGIWALIGQAHGLTTITNGHEQIYALGKAQTGFVDIVSGSNGGPGDVTAGGYPTKVGYDLATGWGSPDVSALVTSQGWLK